MLVDTHCHIHEASYPLPADDVLLRARDAGVDKMICVGTNVQSSHEAIAFARNYDNCFASIGVHPHDTKDGKEVGGRWNMVDSLQQMIHDTRQTPPTTDHLLSAKIVAIGEIGLDYFYTHSSRDIQILALQAQLQLAIDHDLPVIFHVRDAFDDFWPILDNFHGVRGVLHSFTDTMENMTAAIDRGLYIGVNGISTFTKDATQMQTFKHIPIERLLLETDAPFLTPVPLRGKVNEPAFVRYVAQHHATIRGLPLDHLATATSTNAHALFAL